MANRWIVTALGQDRPGIVAGVTKALYQLGCNLEDSAMTRLEGEFAIMLIFSSPPKITEARLKNTYEPLERQLKLAIHLKRLNAKESRAPRKSPTWMISVYGADHPGIVYRVSEALAKAKVNITDVHTHRSAGRGPSLYLMLLEVETSLRQAALEKHLHRLSKTLGVQMSVRPSDAAVL